MKQIFRIAISSKLNKDFNVIGDKSKVSEDLFWQMVTTKVKEITNEFPEKFEETLAKVENHLKSGESITILDTWFEVKNG